MKKNIRKVIPLIILFVFIIVAIIAYGIAVKSRKSNTSTSSNVVSIEYDASSEDLDFSKYDTKEVKLSSVKGKYEITKKGVYVLTGELSGYIEVNSEDNVVLVLKNATIKNDNGPCINVLNAKNVYIKLDGNNSLSDGSSYSGLEDGVNAVIYSKDDLILYGDGSLSINGNYEDAIVSKDDLKILGGKYIIETNDDGIKGKDSVTIADGNFEIISGGDAIKSTNSEESDKGNILIQKGTFKIVSYGDGISSENVLDIEGGTFDITTGGGTKGTTGKQGDFGSSDSSSETESTKGLKAGTSILINDIKTTINSVDDGIHTNGNITINKGDFTINSDDDAIHADGLIEINNGTFNINAAEGIEATYIKINDGTITISATDDGINAGNKSDAYSVTIEINGGHIKVDMAQGDTDGIDSNGDLYINGGTVEVNCNSPFDYDGTAEYNGGTIIVNGEETNSITNQMMGGQGRFGGPGMGGR